MLFSIVVVALNPGGKILKTVESILGQGWRDYEILVKDGLSKDGSIEDLEQKYAAEERLRIVRKQDRSIYDAMNQALDLAEGDYVLFLNCGDSFYEEAVLEKTAGAIAARRTAEGKDGGKPCIFYGDTFCEQTGAMVHSAPKITGFTCYRNIPCHQSCFYDRRLFEEKRYDTQYRIRADYDHFLWCFYRGKADMAYLDFPVSAYEGGGVSEEKKNRDLDRREHRKVTKEYMGFWELSRYRLAMALTLAPLRSWMAGSKRFSGFYHRMKSWLYRA